MIDINAAINYHTKCKWICKWTSPFPFPRLGIWQGFTCMVVGAGNRAENLLAHSPGLGLAWGLGQCVCRARAHTMWLVPAELG